mmetsp:Transcript_26316/g.75902  ORF Transcript_26316/g.75902 Transcript_26316/m.75902 type:complete len:278 (-) Transcript_26316:534-1367(-)
MWRRACQCPQGLPRRPAPGGLRAQPPRPPRPAVCPPQQGRHLQACPCPQGMPRRPPPAGSNAQLPRPSRPAARPRQQGRHLQRPRTASRPALRSSEAHRRRRPHRLSTYRGWTAPAASAAATLPQHVHRNRTSTRGRPPKATSLRRRRIRQGGEACRRWTWQRRCRRLRPVLRRPASAGARARMLLQPVSAGAKARRTMPTRPAAHWQQQRQWARRPTAMAARLHSLSQEARGMRRAHRGSTGLGWLALASRAVPAPPRHVCCDPTPGHRRPRWATL